MPSVSADVGIRPRTVKVAAVVFTAVIAAAA
jgi:hypothetical protein